MTSISRRRIYNIQTHSFYPPRIYSPVQWSKYSVCIIYIVEQINRRSNNEQIDTECPFLLIIKVISFYIPHERFHSAVWYIEVNRKS